MCPGFPFLELPCMKGIFSSTTADGRNPAPPGMYKTLQIMGYLPYQLVSRISSVNSSTGLRLLQRFLEHL